MSHRLTAIACAAASMLGCGEQPPASQTIRFLHTFNPDETELFNATIAERGLAVDSSLVPFARGQQVISEILQAKTAHRLLTPAQWGANVNPAGAGANKETGGYIKDIV